MSGRVLRDRNFLKWQNPDIPEFDFLLDGKTGYAKKFESRTEALRYFQFKERFTLDDMRFVYWMDDADGIRRNLLSNKPYDHDWGVDGAGSGLTANAFWTCDTCGRIFRKTEHMSCQFHPEQKENDNSDALVTELICSSVLTEKERLFYEDILDEESASENQSFDNEGEQYEDSVPTVSD
jgi:hypothetical protein